MKNTLLLISLPLFSLPCFAEEAPQDMSDPLSVYTQAGFGITDKGINLKVGRVYDTGNVDTAAMNILEIKGIGGELLDFRDPDDSHYQSVDNSIDSFRFRNFTVNLKNGRGSQIDISYDVEMETLSSSYSILQALPKFGIFNFYPLAGVGITTQNDSDDGYEVSGTFTMVGLYSKAQLTDKIWINYNPMYLATLSGSDRYKDNAYGAGNDTILVHEVAISYQINPRSNIRYFANWSEYTDISKGDHRIEYNYQF